MGRDALGAGKGWWGEGSVLQPPGHSELPSIQGNLKILPSPVADRSSPIKMATALIVLVTPALRETLTRGTQLSHTQIPHPQKLR